jgi:membrane-bound serine protease (ClpP class)
MFAMPVRVGRSWSFAAAVIAAMLVATPVVAAESAGTGVGKAVLLELSGAIGPATSEYVADGFAEAERRGAGLIILRMDTPGGLDSAMREIIRRILDTRIPVVTYVAPSGSRAASAGTYILYASHVAAMAPSTHLGAATPISIGGGFGRGDDKRDDKKDDKKDDKAPGNAAEAKAVNDAVAYIRGLAGLRGRNAEWAEKAVREAATLTASEALEQKVIEVIADDLAELLRRIDGRTVKFGNDEVKLSTAELAVEAVEPDWRNRILSTITNPNLAYLLLIAGFYGLLFEFISPGAVAPGVIGGICLLVGLYALNLLPVNYAGFALILLGMGLMVAEVFIGSFGVIGVGGVVAFLIGSLLLFRGDVPGFELSLPVVVGATLASAAFFLVAIAAMLRAHRRPVVTGEAELIGSSGRVLWWEDGEGDVHARGERWHALSASPLVTGDRVRIVERRGLTLSVEPAGEPDADDARR